MPKAHHRSYGERFDCEESATRKNEARTRGETQRAMIEGYRCKTIMGPRLKKRQ
jgi:hypothetical protein